MKTKRTREEVLSAVAAESGCVSRIAVRLKVDPGTMYNYMERWSSVADAVKAWRLDTAYLAEGSLRDKVIAGEAWAVQFVLRTQGRPLGYGEETKIEIDATHSVALPDDYIAAIERGHAKESDPETD